MTSIYSLLKLHVISRTPRIYNKRFFTAMSKPRIYITRQVNKETLDLLNSQCEVKIWQGEGPVPKSELINNLKDTQGLFCMLTDRIDKEILDNAKSLKVIASMAVGYDHLKLPEIKKRGIKVGYTPDVLTEATAELTLALLLATSRRLIESAEAVRNGGWKAWAPFWMCGPGLKDSTVGIVGYGRIGQQVARLIKPFNPQRILYQNRSERKEASEVGAIKVTFDDLLAQSDFIIVTVSLTPETTNLFDAAAFDKMKKTAVFINSSRGAIVDQDALVDALNTGKIWGAGLDVMTPEPLPLDSPLLKCKNCVLLPHIGSANNETREGMGILTARNLLAGLNGEQMPSELKF